MGIKSCNILSARDDKRWSYFLLIINNIVLFLYEQPLRATVDCI